MIVLLGCGGETSRRIIGHARHQGIQLRLAARDPGKARIRLGELAEGWDIVQMTADDGGSVSAALEPGDVLLNGTTPSGALGHSIARAAIASGAHYTSFTGEALESRRLEQELDESARQRGVTLCPGTGCFPVLGDIAMRLALRELPDACDGYIGYAPGGFSLSFGSLFSELSIMQGPALIVKNGELVEENVTGEILEIAGKTLVFRPLMDALMVSTYSTLRNFRSGFLVSSDQAAAVSQQFIGMAQAANSASGRERYLNEIESKRGQHVEENVATDSGTVTAILLRGADVAEVTMTAQPIYEQAARAALLISRELDELKRRPAGFQAASSVVRSIEYALEKLGVRLISPAVIATAFPHR
ncbi:MAG TPA: saccharopine dehydrogenase NADP-binding domain-containing protein [Steroidobacteraceae bacterium]|nr:saccharopine dehydrogenase NADP-binding domain-containing protein [Steroidobacteraceae bacterium]